MSAEEEAFGRTLEQGTKLFEEVAARAKDGVIDGADAFKLHDTYGFPYDVTRDLAEERGLTVDEAEFETNMARQREQSRAGGAALTTAKGGLRDAAATLATATEPTTSPATTSSTPSTPASPRSSRSASTRS